MSTDPFKSLGPVQRDEDGEYLEFEDHFGSECVIRPAADGSLDILHCDSRGVFSGPGLNHGQLRALVNHLAAYLEHGSLEVREVAA